MSLVMIICLVIYVIGLIGFSICFVLLFTKKELCVKEGEFCPKDWYIRLMIISVVLLIAGSFRGKELAMLPIARYSGCIMQVISLLGQSVCFSIFMLKIEWCDKRWYVWLSIVSFDLFAIGTFLFPIKFY